jgi:carboxyl-terminal processing protease
MYSNQDSESSVFSKSTKRGLGFFLAFCFAFGAFFSGIQVGKEVDGAEQSASLFNFFASKSQAEAAISEPDLSEFWKVWSLMDEKFATASSSDVVSSQERLQGAIDGLVDAFGDPYTVYLPPEDAASFNEDVSGNFSGVGMEVGLREGLVTVISPLPDTPAQRAGIVSGDVVVKIDDVSTEGMRIDEAVKLIRGEQGTVVTLQIFREGELEFLTIPITRDTIDIPTVKTEQIGDTFVIALYSFNALADSEMQKALREYQSSGATKLVFDVRGNPGGFLQSAVSIASYFLPAGKIVVKEEFGDESKNDVFRSRGQQVQLFTPEDLVVLVDGGSASAAEILAGALQDHGVATVIGAQTFGKGSVQELVNLDGGASLKVTVARWLTPNGTSISNGGLTPDIVIGRTPQQRIADEDPQKDAAVRFLAGEEVVSDTFEDVLTEGGESGE